MTTQGDAPPRALRVVLVDDMADLRLLLRSMFELHPDVEVVGEARNGAESILVVADSQPDLVVLDMNMPVMDGLSALPRLRQVAPGARIVVLSAIPERDDPGALAGGAVAYVQKGVGTAPQLVPELLAAAGLLDGALAGLRPRSHSTTLPRTHESPGVARRFTKEVLGRELGGVLDTVELLVSELVTNAVVHAGSQPKLALHLYDDHIHVEVLDEGPGTPTPRVAGPDEQSGRGMVLVETLARRWGTTELPGGKIVWFDVARTSPV